MTGTQQSGSGGNPSFDSPKKSVGGAVKSRGPVTATPGKGTPKKEVGDVRDMQQQDDESDSVEKQSNAAGP